MRVQVVYSSYELKRLSEGMLDIFVELDNRYRCHPYRTTISHLATYNKIIVSEAYSTKSFQRAKLIASLQVYLPSGNTGTTKEDTLDERL
jgi:hypothetical protein